ncbi:MAG: DNA repair protein RecN [Candidatus Zixiibacteriota bacterium]
MLTKLIIENIALVPYAELDFGSGLCVLTGETGAGKSVVVSALSLALGERAEKDSIRHKEEYAGVTAVFDVTAFPAAFKKQFDVFIDNDEIVIERIISRDTSSKVRINEKNVTLNQLNNLAVHLAEIMGQNSGQLLMNEENHLDYLDEFGGLTPLRETISEMYYEWKRVHEELRRVLMKHADLNYERELLLHQKADIEQAQIRVGEEQELNEERKIQDSARALLQSAALISTLLEEDNNSIIEQLSVAQKELQKMADVDSKLNKQTGLLNDSLYQLQDLARAIQQYGSSIESDHNRLEEINLRLDEIYRLKKKFGGSEKAILGTLAAIKSKLGDGPEGGSVTSKLEAESNRLYKEYRDQALKLSDIRRRTANYLEKLVIKELSELAINRGKFKFDFVFEDDPEGVFLDGRAVKASPAGLEKARILFSANPGEPLKPLVKCASGGEISRVLLALKSASKSAAKAKAQSLMVFDEIDAGIGGHTASEVGKKLKRLSQDCQVLVITHLHQIARLADYHFAADKTASFGRATIAVRKLDSREKAAELKRMVALPEKV